jgi:hypothetical protein
MRASRLTHLAWPLLAATLLLTSAQAMEIRQFDRMSPRDQDAYVVLLLTGTKQVLTDAGRADQAGQVEKLFTTRQPGDENTLGMVELELNLSAVRKTDAGNLVKDPNAKPLPVEFAMIGTLKERHHPAEKLHARRRQLPAQGSAQSHTDGPHAAAKVVTGRRTDAPISLHSPCLASLSGHAVCHQCSGNPAVR